jgi:arylsulfatase A-like enzyme
VLGPADDRPVLSETRYGIAPDRRGTEVVALRTAAWKLVQLPSLDRYELYDLRDDPAERHDRYADAPEAAALVARLAAWQAPPAPVSTAAERDPHVLQKLRALGYVE